MVVRNKSRQVAEKFAKILEKRFFGASNGNKKSIRSKLRVLDFFKLNGVWPSRLSENKKERTLGVRFENYVSKESRLFDRNFRRLALATGRKTNNKRKHNVQENKKLILEFIKEHGRVPCVHTKHERIKGEHFLRSRLDNYTNDRNDMTLLGQVYDLDPCHKSGIPNKYRSIINKSLDVEKPLIRLVNKE